MAKDDLPILNLSNPKHMTVLLQYVKSLKGKGLHSFEIRQLRDQRSLSQNSYLHGVVFQHIAVRLTELWGEKVTMLDAKAFLKDKYLREPLVNHETGETRGGYITRDTHSLDMDECRRFIESCLAFARDDLDDPVPELYEYTDQAV